MRLSTTIQTPVDMSFSVRYVYWSPSQKQAASMDVNDFGGTTHMMLNFAMSLRDAISQNSNPSQLAIPVEGVTALRLGMITLEVLLEDYPELPEDIRAAIRMMR